MKGWATNIIVILGKDITYVQSGDRFSKVQITFRSKSQIERFSYDLEKWVSVSVRYLFHKPMDEKIKTWTLRFPATDNPNMEKALFDWPVVLQYDVKAKYRLISRKLFGHEVFQPSVRLTNQKPRAFESVRQTNQIALFPFVCCFCFVRAFSIQGRTKIVLLESKASFRRQIWPATSFTWNRSISFRSVHTNFERLDNV